MKIGIFTGRLLNPMHPRIASQIDFFEKNGIAFEIFPPVKNRVFSRINWVSLYFFDLWSVYKFRSKLKSFDIIFIHDLKYLPLAVHAKKLNKSVVYETLDNNVALREYQLLSRFPFLKIFKKSISASFIKKEKNIAFTYCDKIIVNSKALLKYFDNRAELIYYSSSFENMQVRNSSKNKPALLYLGEFSSDKGADDVLSLQKTLDADLFIFGTIREKKYSEAIENNRLIIHSERINHAELIRKIEALSEKYFLTGMSFIKPVHHSYATQEANKDIDYLSIGIPIIGNHREPTAEKIKSGCGIFQEDEKGLQQLMSDEAFREEISVNCRNYYAEHYSHNHFTTGMEKIFSQFTGKGEC